MVGSGDQQAAISQNTLVVRVQELTPKALGLALAHGSTGLAEQEHQQRHQARLRPLLHEGQLPVPKALADMDWGAIPDRNRHQVEQLGADTGWLDRDTLLVIDDSGYVRKDAADTSVLFETMMHRYERKSLLVTRDKPFSEWENVFCTSAMTVAAMDRLVDHSTLIRINGESYRRRRARRIGRSSAG